MKPSSTSTIFLRSGIIFLTLVLAIVQGRRVKLKSPAVAEQESDDEQLQRQLYYPSEQQDEDEDNTVVIARQSPYVRVQPTQRSKSDSGIINKSPPVQTIRNFNKVNDDGSFTFGYEAADGSFKEETRGTDCVVRGKYGYVDPDGNKREFTYVSGNPCDPNAISQEDNEEKEKSIEENVPANYPRRQNFILRPVAKSRPATTVFQQSYNNEEQGEEQDEQITPQAPQPIRTVYRNNIEDEEQAQILRATPRPVIRTTYPAPSTRVRLTTEKQPATTYRPQITQQSTVLIPKQSPIGSYVSSTPQPEFFDQKFKKFQLENNVIPTQGPPSKQFPNNQIYSTELVYDPSTGQYNTVVFQQLPKVVPTPTQRVPFITTPQPIPPRVHQVSSTTTQTPLYQQQLLQQQQTALIQRSQQLYNQLRQQQPGYLNLQSNKPRVPQPGLYRFPQESRFLQEQRFPVEQGFTPEQRFSANDVKPQPGFSATQQPVYYINPNVPDGRQNVAAGQIEAFLRGHNLHFE